jgi:hypothetical protein
MMRDRLFVATEGLVDQLTALRVSTAADPRAANDPVVMDMLEECEKYKMLMADRHALYSTTAKKADTIRAEVLKLEKDVGAVVKAKSGFFSTSKSLPQLKALSTALHKFADDLGTASAGL